MESYTIESNKKKSRVPARLDFLQSGIGLVLSLFVWVHIVLAASIVFGPGAFNWVSKNMALAFLSNTGHGYPIAVFFTVLVVFTLFIVHALLGIRKFPVSWKQYRIMKNQMAMMKHQDTNFWYVQVLTGFVMVFAGSVHLYNMLTHPGAINAYLCANRVVFHNMWFVYLILLVCVVLHGNIGLYRLCMKWGWFQGTDHQRARMNRAKLKNLRNKLIIVFLIAGVLTLLVFVVIGLRHKDGAPYQSTRAARTHGDAPPAVETFHEARPGAETVHEQAPIPVEETVPHDSAPVVREFEPAHEEAVDAPGDVQEEIHEEAAGDDAEGAAAPSVEDTVTHDSVPAVQEFEPAHEDASGDDTEGAAAAPSVEETVTHDNVPVVQEDEPAHEDAVGDPGDVQDEIQEEGAGDDEPAHEATFDDAEPSEPEENDAQREVHPIIDGGHGPQETL